jgi:hypothetical protein
VQIGVNDAFGGAAARPLGCVGQALLSQDALGGVDVAAGLRQGFLGVHHPGAGCVAQRLDVSCSDLSH